MTMGIWTSLLAQYDNWKRVRETTQELEALDERSLEDLGINRVDIRLVAKQTVAMQDRATKAGEVGLAQAGGATLQAG
jgi:uncharacterized protein YjiS (DUF1127 family)